MAGPGLLLVATDESLPADLTVSDCRGGLTSAFPELTVDTCRSRAELPDGLDPTADVLVTTTTALDDWLSDHDEVVRGRPVLVVADSETDAIPVGAVAAGQLDCVCLGDEADPTGVITRAVADVLAEEPTDHQSGRAADLREVIETLGDPVYMLDREGRLALVNEALVTVTGRSRETLLGTHVGEFIADADVEAGLELLDQLRSAEDRSSGTYEMEIIHADGSRRVYENHLSVLEGPDGRFRGSVGIIRDIQDRLSRERELEQYETIVETVPEGVFILDAETTIVGGNERGAEILGIEFDRALGTTVQELVADGIIGEELVDRYTEVLPELLSADADRTTATVEFTVSPPDSDDQRICEGRIALRPFDEDGAFRGVVGIIRDVTARKARERELEQYETIVQTMPDGVVVTDEETRIVGGNQQAASLLGMDYEEMLGVEIEQLVADGVVGEQAADHYLDVVPKLLSSETDQSAASYEFTVSPVGQDETRVIRERLALRPFDEEFRGAIGVVRDVTERKQRIDELERYEALVQAVPDTLFATDEQGNLDFANEAGLDRFGYTSADVESGEVHFSETVADEDVEKFTEAIRRHLADEYDTGQKAVVEYTALTRDGRRFPAETHFALREYGGDGVAGAGIVRDITERKQHEQQLQVLNRVLRHNLRNDLSVIFGSTESLAARLREEYGDEEGASIAESARQRGQELVEMSEEIRQIQTALERERLDRPTVDAVAVVTDVVERYRAAYPGADIETDLPERALLEADTSLEIAVDNLVENAIEHNDDSPTVRVTVGRHDTDRGDWYEIRVADDGPGIPAQEQSVVEEDASVTPLQHASGIGLWAVAWIVHSFDGRVHIDSGDGGSSVTVTLRSATE